MEFARYARLLAEVRGLRFESLGIAPCRLGQSGQSYNERLVEKVEVAKGEACIIEIAKMYNAPEKKPFGIEDLTDELFIRTSIRIKPVESEEYPYVILGPEKLVKETVYSQHSMIENRATHVRIEKKRPDWNNTGAEGKIRVEPYNSLRQAFIHYFDNCMARKKTEKTKYTKEFSEYVRRKAQHGYNDIDSLTWIDELRRRKRNEPIELTGVLAEEEKKRKEKIREEIEKQKTIEESSRPLFPKALYSGIDSEKK